MDAVDLVLLVVAWGMLAFSFGAVIAWRLEGRRPLVAPLWIVVARNLAWIAWALYVAVALDAPKATVTIDPLWWNLAKAFVLAASLLVFVIEVRNALRDRPAA